MQKALLVSVIILVLAVGGAAYAQTTTTTIQKATPPPAIHVPAGGTIVTEINVSDSDILGIVKQAVPTFVNTIGSSLQGAQLPAKETHDLAMLKALDMVGLIDAIKGITNVRFLIVGYQQHSDAQTFLSQFNHGVEKIGNFKKVASDFAFMPGAFALYTQPDNGGYIGVLYDAQSGVAYIGRVVGSVDIVKLSQWAANAIGTVVRNDAAGNKVSVDLLPNLGSNAAGSTSK